MKLLILITLLFPCLAYSITKAKKKDVCEKIRSDFDKAHAGLIKIFDDSEKALEDIVKSKAYTSRQAYAGASKTAADVSKAYADLSKIYADLSKYKCLKDNPLCNESLKSAIKANAGASAIYADASKAYADTDKSKADLSKVDAYASSADAFPIIVYRNVKKYCE